MRRETVVRWIDPATSEIREGQWWAEGDLYNTVWAVPNDPKLGENAVLVYRSRVKDVGKLERVWRSSK